MDYIVTEYHGIKIQYDRWNNRWIALDNLEWGNSPPMESMQAVEAWIDKKEKASVAKKKKKTVPITAILTKFNSSDTSLCKVTSRADSASYRTGEYYWVTNSKGDRSKESVEALREYTEEKWIIYRSKIAERDALTKEISKILKPFDGSSLMDDGE